MPYKDPARKTEWDHSHRPEKLERIRDAARWADEQLRILAGTVGPVSREERKALRKALISQFLNDRYGNGVESFSPAAPTLPPDQ